MGSTASSNWSGAWESWGVAVTAVHSLLGPSAGTAGAQGASPFKVQVVNWNWREGLNVPTTVIYRNWGVTVPQQTAAYLMGGYLLLIFTVPNFHHFACCSLIWQARP